jgi:hypothetical protein
MSNVVGLTYQYHRFIIAIFRVEAGKARGAQIGEIPARNGKHRSRKHQDLRDRPGA